METQPIPVAFVDDDADLREANAQALSLAGYRPCVFASAEEALDAIDAGFAGVVVTDLRMPRIDGMQLFRRLKIIDPELPVILITGHGDVALAVDAMKEGAYDFIVKPYTNERLGFSLARAVEQRKLTLENRSLRERAERVDEDLPLIGETPSIQALRRSLRQIAATDVDVLVTGETGSGKEVVARLLHQWSPQRRDHPFVALNCGALPESVIESELFGHEAGAFTGAQKKRVGQIEYSSGGTLFLDEIESMPVALQIKLLRVLELREITPLGSNVVRRLDLRVVAAAKVDLGNPRERGDFREDLYYRLNVVTIDIPALRARRQDIPLLFAHFVTRAAQRFRRDVPSLSAAVRKRLQTHDWPGNVRELSHFAERVALGLEPDDEVQPAQSTGLATYEPGLSLPERLERIEGDLIREALSLHSGDVRLTLLSLGLPRKTFYDKLQRHGIERRDYE